MKGLTEEEEEEVKKDYDIHTLMKHSTGVLAQIHYKPIPSNVRARVSERILFREGWIYAPVRALFTHRTLSPSLLVVHSSTPFDGSIKISRSPLQNYVQEKFSGRELQK